MSTRREWDSHSDQDDVEHRGASPAPSPAPVHAAPAPAPLPSQPTVVPQAAGDGMTLLWGRGPGESVSTWLARIGQAEDAAPTVWLNAVGLGALCHTLVAENGFDQMSLLIEMVDDDVEATCGLVPAQRDALRRAVQQLRSSGGVAQTSSSALQQPEPGQQSHQWHDADLNLLKEFKMKPGTDDGGVLRWMHDDHGFVFRLKDTLATLPAEYFDKADWEPMISDVLMEASEIIGDQDWPNELGFEEFDTFSKDVLSSGVQAEHAAGVLISSMGDFMAQHEKRTKHLRKCTGEVTEKLDVVKSTLQKLDDMEELNRTIDDYEFAYGGDERLELAPKLKALLALFDYTDGLDDPDGLRMAYEDFQDGSAVTAATIDEELLAGRIDLMRVLAKLAVSVEDRVEVMEKMLPEVEKKAKNIQMKADHLCALCEAKTETINELPVSGNTRQWVLVLDATKKATQQVAKCAELMLVKHPRSIANNIRKDIEQTQDTGRAHDAMHFDTYCAAWSKTLEDETFVKAEKTDIEARIDQVKSDFISARRGK